LTKQCRHIMNLFEIGNN